MAALCSGCVMAHAEGGGGRVVIAALVKKAMVGGGWGGGGGLGGSGVVILRMLTAGYSGITTGIPTVTTDGNYTILKFTGSGEYTT